MKPARLILVATVAVVSVVAVGTVALAGDAVQKEDKTPLEAADRDNPPPRPEWVRSDGTVDHSKAPECVEAAGPDGKTVMKGNGEPVCIPFHKLHGPPPNKPVDVEEANRGAQEKKGPNGKTLMVVPEKRASPSTGR